MSISKELSDYDVALKHLNEQYCLSKVEYKLYHPNLLKNDVYINHYQQICCNFDFVKLKNKLTRKINKYTHKKWMDMMYTLNKKRLTNIFKRDKYIIGIII